MASRKNNPAAHFMNLIRARPGSAGASPYRGDFGRARLLPSHVPKAAQKIAILKFVCLVAAAGLLSGCLSRTDNTQYFLLSAPASAPSAAVESNKVFLVGLRITAADFLRTKQMLIELGPNQLRLSEENVWQETPQAGFARVLAERFAQTLPDCDLGAYPSTTTNTPELVLEIELQSMQGRLKPRGEAEVSAEVRLLDAGGRLLEREELRRTSPWSPTTPPDRYPALAAAESKAASALADEIAQKVAACHRKMSGR